MIVVPYTYSESNVTPQLKIHRIQVLCEGGQNFWKEDEQPIQNILEPNDIYAMKDSKHKLKSETYHIVEIDTNKTNLKSLYTWNEISVTDSETLCLRSFVFFTNTDNNSIWLSIPESIFKPILSVILKTNHGITI